MVVAIKLAAIRLTSWTKMFSQVQRVAWPLITVASEDDAFTTDRPPNLLLEI
jgi:hypothetical protein